jgi:murein DD-endopeptidase MepM/ murein hydrolase activator NlpD
MQFNRFSALAEVVPALRASFKPRDLFFHNGATMRRIHLTTRLQAGVAAGGALGVALSLFGAAQVALGAPAVANAVAQASSRDAAITRMNAKVAAMEAEMATIRTAAAQHAKRLEVRQAMLDAMVTGKGTVPSAVPVAMPIDGKTAGVVAPLAPAEARQDALAAQVAAANNARYQAAVTALGRMGLNPVRFKQVRGAMGGPFEPVPQGGGAATRAPDPQFRALFQSWKRLEQIQQGIVAIPSARPTEAANFTSGFGVRADPFGRGAAMHAGVDIAGPLGTPIYATADGIVRRAEWAGGYGRLIEIDHGRGITTRYGHLANFAVTPGMRVTRGQFIGGMGSTGRSTGVHLHYEVRLDGQAVNPMPFLQSSTYLAAIQQRGRVAMGGPREAAR